MNDDFLVSLGLELYQEFQQWNYSLIDNWLNSIELLEKDLQPLARLHLAVEDLSEITDLFRDWEAWLTADFVPSLRSKNGEMSSLERDSSPVDLGVNTSSFMSFSRQSLASASDYTQPNPRVRTSNYPPLQKEQENSYNIRQKKQISFDDNHQANNIYPQNNATKSQRELTDLVRDISAENLPLDSAIAADIISQPAEMLPIPPQLLQQSREKLYYQINNINSNFSNIQKTELEINEQQSENQSFNQHPSLQDTEQQAIDLDYILETLQTKINQEYRRFYGG